MTAVAHRESPTLLVDRAADRARRPVRFRWGEAGRRVRPSWWHEVILLGLLYVLYEVGRALPDGDVGRAMANGRRILSWERAWHLSPEHLLNQGLSQVTALSVVAGYFYATLHYLVTPAVLIWLYREHQRHYRRARTTLAVATSLALLGYYLMPTAPPRLLRGAGIHDVLASVQTWGWWGGDGSVPRGMGGLTNQFAAMPSLHVGWAVWSGVSIASFASHRIVRWLGGLYPLVTTLVVVSTGNHYLLDAVAGALTIVVGYSAALSWTQVGEGRPAHSASSQLTASVP